jgi:ribonuclease HI
MLPESLTVLARFDGAVPGGGRGEAGFAAVFYVDNNLYGASPVEPVFQTYDTIGDASNNEAEYLGAIRCLAKLTYMLEDYTLINLELQGDSQLVINHLSGASQCNAANLWPLYVTAMHLLGNFPRPKLT